MLPMNFFSPLILAFAVFSGCSALLLPPKGAVTIGGRFGKYSTISSGLNDTSSNVYFIYAGNYTEQVYITRPNLKVYGQTALPGTYLGNKVLITNNVPASVAGSNDASGTVRVHGTNVSLYNLDIANTYGDPEYQSQAIALSLYGTSFGGYGLKLTGYQDTLLANQGDLFISSSWIEGAVDFIFGRTGSLWITKSIINVVSGGNGCVTASGRQSNDPYWYVIDESIIQGKGSNGTAYLGRPWGAYARVVFQHSFLGSIINHAGWSIWNPGDERTSNVTFAEYKNIGPGAIGPRANFSEQLTKPIGITTVLNSTSWIDRAFL